MDWSAVTDIQYAILALQDVRCGLVKHYRGSPIPKRTYCSKLDAVQRELRCIIQSLKTLANLRYWMSNLEKQRERRQFKRVAFMARLGVSALSYTIDQLKKDVDRGLLEKPTEVKHLSECAVLWNYFLVRLLANVLPMDQNTIDSEEFNLLRFYDTMRDLDSELAVISTDLGLINQGMTFRTCGFLQNTVTKPPTKSNLHRELGGARGFLAQDIPASRPRITSSDPHAERHANDLTPSSDRGGTKRCQTASEDSPAVPRRLCPNNKRPFHSAKDSLDLYFKFPLHSGSEDLPLQLVERTPPRYTQTPHAQQVPLPDDRETNPEHPGDLPDVICFNRPNFYKPQRSATASLPPVNGSVEVTKCQVAFSPVRSPRLCSSKSQRLKHLNASPRPRVTEDRSSRLAESDDDHRCAITLSSSVEGRLYRYHNRMGKSKEGSDKHQIEPGSSKDIAGRLSGDKQAIDNALAPLFTSQSALKRLSSASQRPMLYGDSGRRRVIDERRRAVQRVVNASKRRVLAQTQAAGRGLPSMERSARPGDETASPRESVKDKKTCPSTKTLEAFKNKDKQETKKEPFAERNKKKLTGIVDWAQAIIA